MLNNQIIQPVDLCIEVYICVTISIASDSASEVKEIVLAGSGFVGKMRNSVSYVAALIGSSVPLEGQDAVMIFHWWIGVDCKIKADPEQRTPALNVSNHGVPRHFSRQTLYTAFHKSELET